MYKVISSTQTAPNSLEACRDDALAQMVACQRIGERLIEAGEEKGEEYLLRAAHWRKMAHGLQTTIEAERARQREQEILLVASWIESVSR